MFVVEIVPVPEIDFFGFVSLVQPGVFRVNVSQRARVVVGNPAVRVSHSAERVAVAVGVERAGLVVERDAVKKHWLDHRRDGAVLFRLELKSR